MADRVQFILDRMAPSFRDMEQFGVFSAQEVRSVVKRRTDFEYRLRRRQQTPADYYGYLKYELGLEQLRDARCRRQSHAQRSEEPELSKELIDKHRKLQTAFMRHISYVFERALRRFSDNMDLWNDYISFLKDKKATSTLNTVFGRALCLHPKNESLWLQAAVFEINENSNAHAARVLLQRALRVNKHSQKLWETYFQLELWHVARGQERRRLLGLKKNAPEEEEENVLGVPWVVFRHATKNIPGLRFAMTLLKATGAGCAAGSDLTTPLQAEIQKEIEERFSDTPEYWAAMVQLAVDERVSLLQSTLQQRRLSVKKAERLQKKRSLNEEDISEVGAALESHQQEESKVQVMSRLSAAASGLKDCVELLQSCQTTTDVDETFISGCWCDALGTILPVLSLPVHADVRLSELDLFRSQKDLTGPNVVEAVVAQLNDAAQFLNGVATDPKLLVAQLSISTVQAILSHQYGSKKCEVGGTLRNQCDQALKWLQENASDASNINVWTVLADKIFHAHSIEKLVAGDDMDDLRALASVVLSRAVLLVNPPQPDSQKQHATALTSRLALAMESNELKTSVLARAIDASSVNDVESGLQAAKLALETALLGRTPTTINISSEPAATDRIYVDWLLRYVQLAMFHEGEAGWRAACEFVEERCFSARPHCVASLDLDRYYEHVVEQAMAFLRSASISGGDTEEVAGFARRLIQGGVSRCPGNSSFLEAEEEAARLAGQHDQANHTRWKRGRAL